MTARSAGSPPVVVRVPAKINLHLSVGRTRRDGYHELVTVFLAVSLYDEVTASPADGLSVGVRGEGHRDVPAGEGNLAWRAATALAEHVGIEPAVRLDIAKQIPVAAGLAGGSADAAATLVACDALWGTGCERPELSDLAAGLGSDVAFALSGGIALGTGRGEVLTPVLATGTWHWVLAIADQGLSTPQVYAELDRQRVHEVSTMVTPDELINGLRTRNLAAVSRNLCNDLQPATLALRPALRATLREGDQLGAATSLVSGSGPTCAFLVTSAEAAVRLAASLSAAGVCRTVRTVTGPVPGARIMTGHVG